MNIHRLLFVMLAVCPALPLAQDDAGQVDWSLSLRPRYELVEQDNFSNDANALTMRTLAGFTLRPTASLSARVEVIDVTQFIDDFNDTRNGKVSYPIVADPGNTDLNELHLTYSGAAMVRAGRQAIRLNRTRFIGGQDFRQTMQVFDGAALELALPIGNRDGNVSLYGGYFDRRSTVRATSGEDDVGIVRVDWVWSSGNSLLLSAYWHDTRPPAGAADASYRIDSIRWDGLNDVAWGARLNYTIDYARQRPYGGNQLNLEADYARAGGGLIWSRAFARIDYEVLGSSDGIVAFQTPMANNHAYLGWSDLFSVAPPEGVRDWWATFGGNVGPLAWVVEHHRLRSDFGGIDFGYETDVGATWTLRKGLLGTLQVASYRSGDDPLKTRPNTNKVWLTVVWSVR